MICFVDCRITKEEELSLCNLGLKPIKIPKSPLLYEAISSHVDIQLNILNFSKREVIVHKDMPEEFLELLYINNIKYIKTLNSLSLKYPKNIILNALITDDFIFHNLKYTDKNLLMNQSNKKFINVKQGYTKCSTLYLGRNLAITSDKGIYKGLILNGFDVLLIPPGNISLPGLNYGFIGGVGGMISSDTLVTFGEISSHPSYFDIKNFLDNNNIKVISLKKGILVDRGSLFTL